MTYLAHVTAPTRRRCAVLGLALAAALTIGIAPSAHAADTVPPVTDLGPTTFSVRGPYAVGEATRKLPTKKGAPVEIWYPATPESVAGRTESSYDMVDWLPAGFQKSLPADYAVTYPSGGVRHVAVAPGRFPLVVFSHGFAGFRTQSSFLTSWLASWGFVVAAPDHFSRDLTKVLSFSTAPTATTDLEDLGATLTLMAKKAKKDGGRFEGHVDTKRVAAVGHSAGGAASEAWAATDERVTTFIGMAGATVGAFGEEDTGPRSKIPRVPGLIMAGASDGVVAPENLINAYDRLRTPKRFVEVGGGHHAFSDLCEVGAADGGLLAIADVLGLSNAIPENLKRLADDGCDPPALPPTEAWPAIRQTVVAQLRHVFGFDTTDAGLTGLVEAYPGVVEDSRSEQ